MAKRGKINNRRKVVKENIERPIRYRKYQQFFLIVCEDENTEPFYFNAFKSLFPPHTIFLKTVGTGRDPLGVVRQSITEKENLLKLSKKEIDFVWAVFDKDDADENETKILRFNTAFQTAEENSINTAFSNEVFELWLLLHLVEISAEIPIPREQIYEELEKHIRSYQGYEDFEYIHGHAEVVEVIQKIGNEQKAIKRAEFLLSQHEEKDLIESNPSTSVHLLVKELRDWISYYNWSPET